MGNTLCVMGVLVFVFLFCPAPTWGQTSRLTEYEVKAAYLYNFAKFVEWPSELSRRNPASLTICILGRDPFDRILDDIIREKTIRGHSLVTQRIGQLEEAAQCHILFVSSSEEDRQAGILKALSGKSILTVGESPHFAELGGVINFVIQANRVRFEINPAAAARARLILSSQLLKLAKIVDTSGGPTS